MRPALLALLAPLALIVLLLFEIGRGNAHEVRGAWAAWMPGALALLGALGPALLVRGKLSREAARGFVLAALAALATYGVLIALVPLAPGEAAATRVWPGIDTLTCAALVGLAALGVRPPWPMVTLAVAAGIFGRAAFFLRAPGAPELSGALFLASAGMLAAALAALRFSVARRSTRG